MCKNTVELPVRDGWVRQEKHGGRQKRKKCYEIISEGKLYVTEQTRTTKQSPPYNDIWGQKIDNRQTDRLMIGR